MKDFLISIFDRLFKTNIVCSIADIILQGENLCEGQLTVLARYYDILQYKTGKDLSFPFQNALSRVLWGDAHKEEAGNASFKRLIESYDRYGYKADSKVILDSTFVATL